MKTFCFCIFSVLLALPGVVTAQNHTITSPGFYYNVDGGAAHNPTITMRVGSTNNLTITTSSIHPVVIANSPANNGVNLYSGATPQDVNSGTISVMIPSNGFPTALYYVCSVHGFFGLIDIIGGPQPPPPQILSLRVSTNVVMTSTGTNTTWLFKPEFSSNLTSVVWAPIPSFTNSFLNGTNTTMFNRLDPICGPNVYVRIRQQQH